MTKWSRNFFSSNFKAKVVLEAIQGVAHPVQVGKWKKELQEQASSLFDAKRGTKSFELIDQEYTRHPFYGSRKIMHDLRNEGYKINRKRVKRLMRILELAGMEPGPSKPHPEHKIYHGLLSKPSLVDRYNLYPPQRALCIWWRSLSGIPGKGSS